MSLASGVLPGAGPQEQNTELDKPSAFCLQLGRVRGGTGMASAFLHLAWLPQVQDPRSELRGPSR